MLGVTTVSAITGLAIAISFALFMLTATWVMLKLSKTLSITNLFLDDVRKQTIPLMTRFQSTVDHLNNELELVDRMVASGEEHRLAGQLHDQDSPAGCLLSRGEDHRDGGGHPEGHHPQRLRDGRNRRSRHAGRSRGVNGEEARPFPANPVC